MNQLSDKIVTTRKRHRCDGCGRVFEPNTKMRTLTFAEDTIFTWRECETCSILLTKFRDEFDDGSGICDRYCVADSLNRGQTPEQLLEELTKST